MSPVLLHHLLDTHRSDGASRPAIIDGETVHTFGDLDRASRRIASAIATTGAGRGDRVAILLPKSFEECAALFAASRAGGVFVPINPVLKPQQIAHILRDSEARCLVTRSAEAKALIEGAGPLPGVAIVAVDDLGPVDADVPPATGISEDLAAILYTSGSTGTPKGVMLSHRNLLAGTRIVRTYLGITCDDRILSILPFSFDYGLNQLLTAVEQGAIIVLGSFQLGDQIVSALAKHRITGLAGVPTIWAILTKAAPALQKMPLPHLRYITNSGGAVPEATVKRLSALLPTTNIFLMYGLTEAFRSTYLPPEEVALRPTSIGKAIPECEVFPVTADGRRAKPGEPGILVHRGPTVSLGYWRRPEETARVLKPNPLRAPHEGADIVCYSGDLVVEDEEGFLTFVGRRDEMIKSAGYRISPTEVEDVLMSTGAFRQIAVIGLPDEWVGQRICAIGVALTGVVDTAAILKETAAKLPGHMVPARIDLVDALPQTPNGKVDYKALVAERLPARTAS
jgi:acyl-CoA ligase (AMP-forming) (exosortase A-associated)